MAIKGIDVSHWQGTIDWNKVKEAGIQFAIIKAGGRGTLGGAIAASRSDAARMIAKARSLATSSAGLLSSGSPDSNIAE